MLDLVKTYFPNGFKRQKSKENHPFEITPEDIAFRRVLGAILSPDLTKEEIYEIAIKIHKETFPEAYPWS